MTLSEIMKVFDGSDGAATTAMYDRLKAMGPAGDIAVNLLRAQKTSSRAKVYRGRGYRGAAYDTKQWAMSNLAALLLQHGPALGIGWGWGEDDKQPVHKAVLYVDLPTGQVSFHTASRGDGPDYAGKWDGSTMQAGSRICCWAARLFLAVPA